MSGWQPTDETYDGECAVCPSCGYRHGDCWEWLNDEMYPVKHECEGCGAKLDSSVSYSTTYTTKLRDPPQ